MNALLRAVAEAVDVQPPHGFSWLGREVAGLDARARALLSPEQARRHLVASLQFQLYHSFYCAGTVVAAPAGSPGEREPEAFVHSLSAANCGMGRWQPGWTVQEVRADSLTATRDGLTVGARFAECRPSGAGLAAGDPVALRFPKESDRRSIGFYMAFGDRELEESNGGVVRVYWHVRAEGAVRLIRLLTSFLNRDGTPFLLKVVDHPDRYVRCDAGVLYLGDWPSAALTVARVREALRGSLRAATPAFTKALAHGLAVAEDPLAGESFGMHRCRVLGEGLVLAAEGGATAIEERLRVVRERFEDEGIDLARPYLNPGSDAEYVLPSVHGAAVARDAVRPGHSKRDWLPAARRIGVDLCQRAFWHEDRCSWIGADPSGGPPLDGGPPGATSSALGPGLYSGTAGVALFLAELAAATGLDDARRTATAAARHALRHAERLPGRALYTGALGVALAAARVGVVLADVTLVSAGRALALTCVRDGEAPDEFDLIGGDAGGVLALLALADLTGDPRLRDGAVALGEDVLAVAVDDGETLRWPARSSEGTPALCGLSHGASGAALALTELFRATGAPHWRDAVLRAFAYERRWFDADAGNWRDLRALPGRPAYMTAWCHGAPGIALARLRAAEILGDEGLRAEAETALRTTRKTVEVMMRHGADDFSLCHGLAGNADVLLLAGDRDVAAAVGSFGLDAHAAAGGRWACGTTTGESPGLMLGLSGIGSFYLRLADAAVPSPLLPLTAALVRMPRQAAVAADEPRARVPAATVSLDDERLGRLVRRELGAHGFAVAGADLAAAATRRWRVGLELRDHVVLGRLPAFADPIDYLSVPDVDPQLWNSLPFMLAFGHDQALALAALAQVEPGARGELARLCAVFSALLSVFDHAVDERAHSDSVFAMEPRAVAGLFEPRGADDALKVAYEATRALPVRLVCMLFAVLGRGLCEQAQRADAGAVGALEDVTLRLFAAQRICTLGTARTVEELGALSEASRTKSVLPFTTLMRIVGLAARDVEPGLEGAARLGRAICLADDLIDLLDDLRDGAPSPLVLEVAERVAARGAVVAADEDVIAVALRAAAELAGALRPGAFGDAEDLRTFARLSVARWVGWPVPSLVQGAA
jgi:hypothetical protein